MIIADCFPVVIYDFKQQILALLHCGWKPLHHRIINNTISQMITTFKTKPSDSIAWIGPGIHACCYHAEQRPTQFNDPLWKKHLRKQNNQWQIDLLGFINQQLTKQGISQSNIHNFNVCTGCSDNYFSYSKNKFNSDSKKRFMVSTHLT